MFKSQNRYLIKTINGYETFKGIQKKNVKEIYIFKFFDNTEIKCSSKHFFLTNLGFLPAKNISKKETICGKKIKSIKKNIGNFEVYDPVGVQNSTYSTNGIISHNTEFLGSSDTLIEGDVLRRLVHAEPIKASQHLKVYETPNENNVYSVMVDVAEGNNNDCSAFIVINMSKLPYDVVAVYKNNKISPLVFPHVIEEVAKRYNNAYVLVETNNVGQQVADILMRDLEYEYVIMTAAQGAAGLKISSGFGTGSKVGLRTTKQTKRVGCVNLKTLVENDKIVLKDYDIIFELSRFSLHGDSYKAESGYDDLCMCLVLFGWFQQQSFAKELSNTDARVNLYQQNLKSIQEDIVPAGEYVNHAQENETTEIRDIVKDYFDRWFFEDPEDIKWLIQ